MANETLVNIGANSAMVTQTGSWSYNTMLSRISTFLQAHGQDLMSSSSGVTTSPKYHQRSFRALNLDGSTYKYMNLYSHSSSYICCRAAQNINATSLSMTGPSQDELESGGSLHQRNYSAGGKMYLFATPRYFMMFAATDDGNFGSGTLNGAEGVFELDLANPDDTYPQYPHLWLNTGYLQGYNSEYGSYCVCPCRSRQYTGENAAKWTRIVTPMGAWGRMQNASSSNTQYLDYNLMDKVMPKVPSPYGVGNRHQIHEMTVVEDTNGTNAHVRGRIVGLKTFTLGTGVNGDVFKIECDANMFLDPTGTLTDHFIIRHGTTGAFGIPL